MGPEGHETFWTLLHDRAHWEFEFFLIFLEQVVVGLCLWPLVQFLWRRWSRHHKADDQQIAELQKQLQEIQKKLQAQSAQPPKDK